MASSVSNSTSAADSSRSVLLPAIPELFNPNFLDVLIPSPGKDAMDVDVVAEHGSTPTPKHPMMEALKGVAHQTFTANAAPAYDSTLSPTLDAFNELTRYTYGSQVGKLLDGAWKEDPGLTLRLIWSLRSIHDGKGEKEVFYRAFGWLYDNHPRTAISNLHNLVTPACSKKGKALGAHGYWKDLLNILALATVGELSNISEASKFLHSPRAKYTYPRSKSRSDSRTPQERIEAAKAFNERAKEVAAVARKSKAEKSQERLVRKLREPKFRALFIAVARLFADQLVQDIKVLDEIASLKPDENAIPLLKKISLAGKWAPTPGRSHDRVTKISTAIAELLYASKAIPFPSSLDRPVAEKERAVILRSFYQRWFLTELRRASCCPEPLMSANRWKEIKYNRVASQCMKNNTPHFFKHDPEGFEGYLTSVESGKKTISGATLMPHEIVAQIIGKSDAADLDGRRVKGLKELKQKLADTQSRVAEAQWKTLIANLRDSGTLENAIAVCDVSGSMGSIYDTHTSRHVQPILPAISLSLVLAALAKPPFSGGFITFSEHPQFVALDTTLPLATQIASMNKANWSMNTDLHAVFVKLLLPLALKNKVKQEDMIKRLFIFSDMQFDACNGRNADAAAWETNYDAIEKAYKVAGYEMPQIVYWDLAASAKRTVEVEGDRKGVAMMNGFSPALLKVFMGEKEEEVVTEWEKIDEDGASVTVVEKEEQEFNPVNVMKRALMKKSFDGLVVVD